MYVELQGKELKKDWKDLNKEAIDSDLNDENIKKDERLLIQDDEPDILDISFDKTNEEILFAVANKYGYFSFNVHLDEELMFEIVECLKSKGEKIERLIDLNK